MRVLCCVRDTITELDQRLPCLAVCFVASALQIAIRPRHPHYKLLNAFLLTRPFLSLEEVRAVFHANGRVRAHMCVSTMLIFCLHSTAAPTTTHTLSRPPPPPSQHHLVFSPTFPSGVRVH